jgi:hypothetical protein
MMHRGNRFNSVRRVCIGRSHTTVNRLRLKNLENLDQRVSKITEECQAAAQDVSYLALTPTTPALPAMVCCC